MLVIQRPSVEAIGDDHPTRQRFAVGPLEPGFGHTIGNSLRRTLLSSIPGAAITTVKFDGVEHEFTTIKGMTEDITEFIMNLKDVVVVTQSDEPVVVRVDVKGPMILKAGDIPSKAEYIINVSWPDNNPNDIDTWVQEPSGKVLWFRQRDVGMLHLDRDDRGLANDSIVVNGKSIVNPLNQEVALQLLQGRDFILERHQASVMRAAQPRV